MNGTFFSVKEAAERVGVSRQTMFRHINSGKVSATANRQGVKQIELSELLRVFGELQEPETVTATPPDRPRLTRTSNATAQDSALIQVEFARLQAQLEIKTAELELAKERINELKAREHSAGEEKNRLLSLIERQSLLLAAPAPVAPQAKPHRTPTKRTAPAPAPATKAKVSKSAPAAPAPAKRKAPTPATKAKATKPAPAATSKRPTQTKPPAKKAAARPATTARTSKATVKTSATKRLTR